MPLEFILIFNTTLLTINGGGDGLLSFALIKKYMVQKPA